MTSNSGRGKQPIVRTRQAVSNHQALKMNYFTIVRVLCHSRIDPIMHLDWGHYMDASTQSSTAQSLQGCAFVQL